ncbi:putative solanesyl-diphosphate synthase 3, chloroplastic [Senna tora]|uniref:Putative solanesyl-diphosphate synthase 3, chloroplastic n=1 Tax=Senna tora TaxID=362788 RepID=A0A834TU48_9FABA|nr:putative solanesyl-diphosphate synthase 3, chloroplastic [Senna tora]
MVIDDEFEIEDEFDPCEHLSFDFGTDYNHVVKYFEPSKIGVNAIYAKNHQLPSFSSSTVLLQSEFPFEEDCISKENHYNRDTFHQERGIKPFVQDLLLEVFVFDPGGFSNDFIFLANWKFQHNTFQKSTLIRMPFTCLRKCCPWPCDMKIGILGWNDMEGSVTEDIDGGVQRPYWLGPNLDMDPSLKVEAISRAFLRNCAAKSCVYKGVNEFAIMVFDPGIHNSSCILINHSAHVHDYAMKNSMILSAGDMKLRPSLEVTHQLCETAMVVLARDFMLAPSSWYLAILHNLELYKFISQVIKDESLKFSSCINLEDKVLLKGGGNVMRLAQCGQSTAQSNLKDAIQCWVLKEQ